MYEVLNHLFSSPNLVFLDCFRTFQSGRFSQCNFKIFCFRLSTVTDIFTHHHYPIPSPTINASYSPGILIKIMFCYKLSGRNMLKFEFLSHFAGFKKSLASKSTFIVRNESYHQENVKVYLCDKTIVRLLCIMNEFFCLKKFNVLFL